MDGRRVLSTLRLVPSAFSLAEPMSLRFAVLGFLSVRPMTGYDLKRTFDQSVRHFWSADQAGIYRALNDLEDDGLVEFERIAQDSRPDRKLYHATSAGLDALDAWLVQPTITPPRREPLLVKLFFAGRMDPSALRTLLDAELDAVTAELGVLGAVSAALEARGGGSDPTIDAARLGPLLTLTNAMALGVAYRDWIRALLTAQADGELSTQWLIAQLQQWPGR